MEPILALWGTVLVVSLSGGLIRTFRDAYKRWVNREDEVFDRYDTVFDVVFGIAAGCMTYLVIGDGASVSNQIALALMSAAYAGADIIDGIFGRTLSKAVGR